MSEIKTGGFAFPLQQPILSDNLGMTMRDYFAAKAMQGSLANFKGECSISEFAEGCYAMADAMLTARATIAKVEGNTL